METYRSGHNGHDSKHSWVCHDCISENPLFIEVFRTSVCTFRKPHLAVFSQFGKLALPLQFYMETYRSGHNGADSKHSRVCHDLNSVNPLFIGVYATCLCTFVQNFDRGHSLSLRFICHRQRSAFVPTSIRLSIC